MIKLWLWLLPELRQFPATNQEPALQKARESELHSVELIGVAIWLVLVTSLTKIFMEKASIPSDIEATLVINFFVVVPLLTIVLFPIHIRRLRRGLRKQLEQMGRS
ncbi:hypothetical protein [Rhodoferax sp.]|uniref:hypothetical protein n=1 Tax=Rhodoferax sp. TaxID=50421 RepID=UPI00261E3021|nr:hypothetical protein [Rhodoferax sp.]MDD2925068.1 hypothetical protein [Rhodoferax sp.]